MIREPYQRASRQVFCQQALAFLERNSPQVVPVQIDKIECVINNGYAFYARQPAFPGAKTRALLHQAERWPPLLIKRHNFAIEDRGVSFYKAWQVTQLGILRRQIVLIA